MNAQRFRRVLVGWDSSPGAAAALLAAAGIADGEVGRVVALAVLRPVPPGEGGEEERAAELARYRCQAEQAFVKARDALSGTAQARVSLEFAESADVARALCRYADAHVFELLVLGRHGTGGVLHPRLGHVAETVAKKSDLPLLLLSGKI
jgi:nucleotide-binding universal stress UspA family protein